MRVFISVNVSNDGVGGSLTVWLSARVCQSVFGTGNPVVKII